MKMKKQKFVIEGMLARRCYKKHDIQMLGIGGRENKYFGHMQYSFYCSVCNKGRKITKVWIKFPKIKKKSEIPF